jgi:septum formation protein
MTLNNFSLVLASGSPYRRELLERLGLPFRCWSPELDELAAPRERPSETARRLAGLKAQAGAKRFPQAWVVGSDQVAELAGEALDKPGTRDRARLQLIAMRSKTVLFHTGVCLLHGSGKGPAATLVTTEVSFRDYSDAEIERYLDREPAFDCAGSAKCEGLGISLISRISGEDPTALIGLPLVALSAMLRAEGIDVP